VEWNGDKDALWYLFKEFDELCTDFFCAFIFKVVNCLSQNWIVVQRRGIEHVIFEFLFTQDFCEAELAERIPYFAAIAALEREEEVESCS